MTHNGITKGDRVKWYSTSDKRFYEGIVIGFNITYTSGMCEYEPIVKKQPYGGLICVDHKLIEII